MDHYRPCFRRLTTLEGGVTDSEGGVDDCENRIGVGVDVVEQAVDQAQWLLQDQ